MKNKFFFRNLKILGPWLYLFALLFFIIVTTPSISLDLAMTQFWARDVDTFLEIARAAPALPTKLIAYHHAQRFVSHYFVGCISKLTLIPLISVYRGFFVSLIIGTLFILNRILNVLNLKPWQRVFCLSLFLANPYTLRYYYLLPPMIADPLFVFGLGLLLLGLVQGNAAQVLLGITISSIGRQTAILVLPGLFLWTLFGAKWKSQKVFHRYGVVALSFVLAFTVYKLTAIISSSFAAEIWMKPSVLISVLPWLFSDSFTWSALAEHLLRVFVPLIVGLTLVVVGFVRKPFQREQWHFDLAFSVLVVLGIASMPLLINPFIEIKGHTRHSALGVFAVVVSVAYTFRWMRLDFFESHKNRAVSALLFGLLPLLSLHHLFTSVGPSSALTFAVWQVAGAFLAGICYRKYSTH